VRSGDPRADGISALNDPATSVALACERAFQSALDGSCATPMGGFATFADATLRFRGEVLAPDGKESAEAAVERVLGSDPERDAAELGREAGLALKPRAAPWLAR
jgi:hydroxymethylbilane synthase